MTTMTSADRFVTGGVDTHRDFHVAAALDQLGAVLDTAMLPTTTAGITVIEVARPNRQVRRRRGKTDVVDAIAAA